MSKKEFISEATRPEMLSQATRPEMKVDNPKALGEALETVLENSAKGHDDFRKIMAEPSMGPVQTAMEGFVEGVRAYAPGLSLGKILSEVGAELGRLGVQGQMELASAIFNGGAFVPYGPGQYKTEAETAIEPPAQERQEQDRGGMEM